MSSLAAQLAGIKSNSNATILDKSKRKKIHTVSLVFEPKEAAQQDFEAIYYTCIDRFREMELIDTRYTKFSKSLFSDTSIRFDRQVQDPEHVDGLNYTIKQFLMLNAAYLHLTPAIYCLEWLVRRFQVHVLNTEELLLSTLASYQNPEFLRILDVVPVASFPPMFKFLLSCKQNNQNPSRNTLVRILSSDKNIFQVVNAYFEQTVAKELDFNRYTVFWSSTVVWVLMAYKEKGDVSVLDMVLPALSNLLVVQKPNIQIATYTIIVVLCSQFSLSQQISDAIISTITKNWTKASRVQGIACISQLVRYSEERTEPFGGEEWTEICKVSNADQEVITLSKTHSVAAFAVRYVLSLLKYSPNEVIKVLPIIESAKLSPVQLHIVVMQALTALSSRPVALIEWLLKNHAEEFSKCLAESGLSLDQVELALQTSLSVPEPLQTIETAQETQQPVETSAAASKAEIEGESANLAQCSAESFLSLASIKSNSSRFDLWLKASSCRQIHDDELLALMRLAPSSEPSFLVSVALSTLPVLCRHKALEIFAKRISSDELNLQMLLPSVLALLGDHSSRVRKAAAAALKSLEQTCSGGKPWGASSIYGQSKDIKTLGKSDIKTVFKYFDGCIDECILDYHQIAKFIDNVGKTSWIEFLIQHALSVQIPAVLYLLLKGLSGHKGVTKELLPLFESWIQNRPEWYERCEVYRFELSQLEEAVVKVVTTSDKTGITFLESALGNAEPLAELAGKHVVSIWSGLKPEVQNMLFNKLINVAVDNSTEFDPSTVLQELPLSGANFAEALEVYKPKDDNADTKRRRRRSSSTQPMTKPVNEIELHLRKVTVLLELLEGKIESMDQPMAVFGRLFDVLNELVNLTSSQIPVLYTQGLVASCLILLLDSAKTRKLSKDSLGAIRVDVLVNCIRTSTNPQIQNKFLLLVASLATICPDLVFHSVMPIFTFMGANTVRLDNDYSAFVIQQTISKVIPALVENGDKVEEIEIALRSFVAAFPHIPRHRRNKLFGALVKTLGPEDSLHKLLLLLGQKFAELQSRKKSVEAKAIVHFVTPFLRSFTIDEQLQAVANYISYIDEPTSGLIKAEELDDDLKQALFEFLAMTFGNDITITGTLPLYMQINAAGALSEQNLALCSSMISHLLKADKNGPAYVVLSACLELLPTDKFVVVLTELANNEVPDLKLRVLQLVERKFELDSTNKAAALDAVNALHANLRKANSVSKNEVIDAMDSIFSRLSLAPELQLEFLGTLCECILSEDIDLQVSAVNAINTVSRNIGARIISHFPKILPVLFAKCKSALSSDRDSENSKILQHATIALISGLIVRIPTFMGSCTGTVLELIMISNIDIKPREALLKLVGEKIDPQTVLNAYVSTWDAASNSVESIDLFFRNLDAVVEETPKKLVGARASQLFGMLLKCFSVRSLQRFSLNEVNHVESVVVGSSVKVVLKLNDKVFRPQFLRMVRWAFEGEGTIVAAPLRHVVFFKFVVKMLGQLKSIVTNYYGYILDNVCAVLESPDDSYNVGNTIVKLIYQSFILSFGSDSDDFWQSTSRFAKIKDVLLGQIKPDTVHSSLLVKAIVALAECSSSQEHRKEINDGLAKHIKSSAPSANKILATRVLSALYVKLGEEWVTSLPQLVPLIAELLDDDDEEVESEVRTHLVPVIEDVLGESMDRYLS